MNTATRTTASIIGIYAGILGAAHGIFETLQGSVAPNGIKIQAIPAPCQENEVWHACLPAMTLIPNFRTTGMLAIIISLIIVVWAAAFMQQKNSGLVLILLSIPLLLVGGGFIPVFTGMIAGFAGTGINASLSFWRARFPAKTLNLLAKLWPWALFAFMAWSVGGWILGYLFNQAMIVLSFVLFFFCNLGLPLLTVLSGFARDIRDHDQAAAG